MHLSVREHSVWAGTLAITFFVVAAEPARSVQQPSAGDTATSAAAKPVELQRLKNEELLKQAGGIWDKAVQEYRAAARALAAAELLLEEASKRADAVAEPKIPDPVDKKPTAEEKAQAVLDAAKSRQAAVRQKLKLVQARKELLDRASSRAEAADSASLAFLQALDDLKSFTLEIELRVKDGSLAPDKIPPDLAADGLD